MTKLTDTQAIILSAASQRDNHIAMPLPDSLRGGAATKVVGVTLVATDAGLAAVGIEPDRAEAKPTEDPTPKPRKPRERTKQARLIAMLRAPDGATIAETGNIAAPSA